MKMLIDARTAGFVGALMMGIFYFMGLKRKISCLFIALAMLATGLIAYISGWCILGFYELEPMYCGEWVAFMLLGLLYSLVVLSIISGKRRIGQKEGASFKGGKGSLI